MAVVRLLPLVPAFREKGKFCRHFSNYCADRSVAWLRHDWRGCYRSGQDRVLRGDCAVRDLGDRRVDTRRTADASVRLPPVSVKAPCEDRSHGAFTSHFGTKQTGLTGEPAAYSP